MLAFFGFNRTALRATQPKLHLMFGSRFLKIALSAAELNRLATSELRFDTDGLLFVGCRQDKFYADKPKTIEALKDNIREAVGKIQLHTIDNVLKDWTDRIGYCIIIFHY